MQEVEKPKRKSKKQLEKLPFPPFPPVYPIPHRSLKKRLNWFLSALVVCVFLATATFFYIKAHKTIKKYRFTKTALKYMEREFASAITQGKTTFPPKLAEIPYGEQTGVVLDVKKVNIRNVKFPYNPSIIPSLNGEGYDLFFRYDVLSPKSYCAPFYSRIGAVHLNNQFEQGDQEYKRLSLHSEYAEDPRALFINDKLYLFCNMLNPLDTRCRTMCIANLDPITFNTQYVTALDLNLQWVEKNWCPFEYVDLESKRHLYIEYQMSPRKLLSLPDPEVNDLRHIPLTHGAAYTYLPWIYRWGQIRGGTPAQKIGNEFLSFFHSSFRGENNLTYYVMGAYTFESHPPFAITRMSEYPILFQGIYNTPISYTGDTQKRVIFPSGYVIEQQKDRKVIHLACGENDCSVKIVTLDLNRLLESMVAFDTMKMQGDSR